MMKQTRLINQKFGRLTVISDSGKRYGRGDVIWECLCECGNHTQVVGRRLIDLTTKSCGCLRKELARESAKKLGKKYGGINAGSMNFYKHGDGSPGREAPLYRIWYSMKKRCYIKNNSGYKYYGQKGIQICPEWKKDYLTFKKWALDNDYKEGLTIDRIDPKGNYEPFNCQFITRSENSRKNAKNIPRDRYGRFKSQEIKPCATIEIMPSQWWPLY